VQSPLAFTLLFVKREVVKVMEKGRKRAMKIKHRNKKYVGKRRKGRKGTRRMNERRGIKKEVIFPERPNLHER
jgi:hypothetical protein